MAFLAGLHQLGDQFGRAEESWRVAGKTHWLWAFGTDDLTYYLIDRSRGEPELRKSFIEEFQGTLVSDFWDAYSAVVCATRQGCLVHLLRDLHTVDHYGRGGKPWPAFAKNLRPLLGDAIRLRRNTERAVRPAVIIRKNSYAICLVDFSQPVPFA